MHARLSTWRWTPPVFQCRAWRWKTCFHVVMEDRRPCQARNTPGPCSSVAHGTIRSHRAVNNQQSRTDYTKIRTRSCNIHRATDMILAPQVSKTDANYLNNKPAVNENYTFYLYFIGPIVIWSLNQYTLLSYCERRYTGSNFWQLT